MEARVGGAPSLHLRGSDALLRVFLYSDDGDEGHQSERQVFCLPARASEGKSYGFLICLSRPCRLQRDLGRVASSLRMVSGAPLSCEYL